MGLVHMADTSRVYSFTKIFHVRAYRKSGGKKYLRSIEQGKKTDNKMRKDNLGDFYILLNMLSETAHRSCLTTKIHVVK